MHKGEKHGVSGKCPWGSRRRNRGGMQSGGDHDGIGELRRKSLPSRGRNKGVRGDKKCQADQSVGPKPRVKKRLGMDT